MATWHQLRRPVRLYHDSKFTVVIDPPNNMRALMLFDTEAGAKTYLANIQARGESHAYILPPANPPA